MAARPRGAPLRGRGLRSRSRPEVPGHGVRCWPAPRHGGGAVQEGRRAGGRPGGLRIAGSRERRGRCLSFPKSRPSGRDLQGEVVGRKIKSVEVRNGRTVAAPPERQAVPGPARGADDHVHRPGRQVPPARCWTTVRPSSSTWAMSGQLQRVKNAKEPKVPHTHAVITFTQGGQLRFVDPRTFGELFVSAAPAEGSARPARARPPGVRPTRGRHELGEVLGPAVLAATAGSRRSSSIRSSSPASATCTPTRSSSPPGSATTGSRTRCRPRRSAGSTGRWSRRWPRRSSAAARRWPTSSTATSSARSGDYQDQHQAYDREGQACRRCRATIVRVKSGGPVDLLLRALPGLTSAIAVPSEPRGPRSTGRVSARCS